MYAAEAERAMASLRVKAMETTPITGQNLRRSSEDTQATESEKDEVLQGTLEPIKTARTRQRATSRATDPQRLLRTTSRAESLGEAAAYEASPYDIDRVNTHASVAGLDLKKVLTNRSRT